MKEITSLRDVIRFDNSFKTAINLYLSLNKPDKVLGYIPTKSSLLFLEDYMNAVIENKEQATLLIGPYGKGKSHLLLVLLAILSMKRSTENQVVIDNLLGKISSVDDEESAVEKVKKIWNNKPYFPILITDSTGDLNQAFLHGLNEALKRENLEDLAPDTYYSIALNRLDDWEKNYPATYEALEMELTRRSVNVGSIRAGLKMCSKESLDIFKQVYPSITAGSEFNPLAVSDVLPVYKSVSERLVEDYNYSGIYIVFDEFSKFIESQDGNAVGSNMKLLQDICELSCNSQNAKVFFTMVAHKSIKEYGKYLSVDMINSFTGIEGRIVEKYFVTTSKNNYELIKNAIIKDAEQIKGIPHYEKMLGNDAFNDYYQIPAFKSKFQKKDFDEIILRGCYPLTPIASYLLLNISEKVAQNERTLFTFISNDEPHSMARFVKEHDQSEDWSIGADLIYDYFETLFKKEVTNEFIHNIWLSAEYVLDKCETEDQKKIIKALAIILIVNKEDEIPADEKSLKMAVNCGDSNLAITELKDAQYIYKKNSTGTFVFKTRAGAELKSEIKKQREIKGDAVNYSRALIEVTGSYYVIPRRYNSEKKMTRFFTNEYMKVDDFLNITSIDAIMSDLSGDGKVITLYNFTAIKQESVKQHLAELADERLVVICPKRRIKLQKQLKDFEIIRELRENHTFTSNNEILKKELPLLLDDLTVEIEETITSVYEYDADTRVLYFDGEKVKNARVGNEELAVNECCRRVYSKTVLVNNEIINRSEINTAQTRKARLNIIDAILTHSDNEDFYSGSNQEATIYRSLFNQILGEKVSDELREIMALMDKYIDSCCDVKLSMNELIRQLTSSPYGMRMGIIPIYFSYVISRRREDIIVYFSDKEIQISPEIIVNMCENSDDYAILVSKEDLQKEKYIKELNILFDVDDNRNLSANRIKDIVICMQRWFRSLPQASRNLVSLEKYVSEEQYQKDMKSIRKELQKVDFNPYEILFVTIPKAFSADSLADTYKVLDECKTLYDDYFDWLQQEAAKVIYKVYGNKKRQDLYHILTEWYEHQSSQSKQGLHDGRTTNFMSCIESLNVFNDAEIALKVVKSATDVYMENWNENSLEEFESALSVIKNDIENIKDDSNSGNFSLSFFGRNGENITKMYNHADESVGSVLRNVIEDALDEFDDLSVNDRVSILLEMIEKVIK